MGAPRNFRQWSRASGLTGICRILKLSIAPSVPVFWGNIFHLSYWVRACPCPAPQPADRGSVSPPGSVLRHYPGWKDGGSQHRSLQPHLHLDAQKGTICEAQRNAPLSAGTATCLLFLPRFLLSTTISRSLISCCNSG